MKGNVFLNGFRGRRRIAIDASMRAPIIRPKLHAFGAAAGRTLIRVLFCPDGTTEYILNHPRINAGGVRNSEPAQSKLREFFFQASVILKISVTDCLDFFSGFLQRLKFQQVWTTTFAGTQSTLSCLLSRVKKSDIFPLRAFRLAGGAAENPRRFHSVEKPAIIDCII